MDIDTFEHWSKERGIKSQALIKKTLYAGYGLFSSLNIEHGCETTVVHIPTNTLLTSQNALNTDSQFAQSVYTILSPKYKSNNESLQEFAENKENERVVLCLFLIYCKFFKASTIWKPYIDILPTLDFFEKDHVLFQPECVAGTNLDNSISAKISNLRKELDEINSIANEHTDKDSWLLNITLEMYMWSDCVFWSRVVGVGGDQEDNQAEISPVVDVALIPYFDFANHSIDNANIRWQRNKSEGIDLVTYPEKNIYKNEELFLSYGSKSNQELLFIHGFCVENNPESSPLTIPLLPFLNPASGEHNMQKIYWLKNLGVKPKLTFASTENNEGDELSCCGWSVDSISTMYLVALDEDDELEFSVDEDTEIVSLFLSGVKRESLEEFNAGVQKLNMYKIIQLRVVYLLLEALEYHLSLNMEKRNITENTTSLWKHASIYRLEEENTLKQAIELLTVIRDKLMQDKTVIAYLGED